MDCFVAALLAMTAESPRNSATSTSPLRLPTLDVRTEASEVAAFAAETGGQPGVVPFTYPMRWLAAPEIAAALADAVEPGTVLVHEAQTFAYVAPLAIDAAYRLELAAERGQEPPRLTLRGRVIGTDGAPHLDLETVLRLVPAPAAA